MSGIKLTVGDLISMLLLIVILGATGVGIFIWMALASWKDHAGVVVGVIFIAVTVIQTVISGAFWRMSRSGKFSPKQNGGIEAHESVELKSS